MSKVDEVTSVRNAYHAIIITWDAIRENGPSKLLKAFGEVATRRILKKLRKISHD